MQQSGLPTASGTQDWINQQPQQVTPSAAALGLDSGSGALDPDASPYVPFAPEEEYTPWAASSHDYPPPPDPHPE